MVASVTQMMVTAATRWLRSWTVAEGLAVVARVEGGATWSPDEDGSLSAASSTVAESIGNGKALGFAKVFSGEVGLAAWVAVMVGTGGVSSV